MRAAILVQKVEYRIFFRIFRISCLQNACSKNCAYILQQVPHMQFQEYIVLNEKWHHVILSVPEEVYHLIFLLN